MSGRLKPRGLQPRRWRVARHDILQFRRFETLESRRLLAVMPEPGLVSDVHAGFDSSNASRLTNVNGTIFFAANEGTNGVELWKSDGTSSGTVLVKDIHPGGASSNPYSLTNIAGTLYFSATDGTNGIELWKSDGSEAGTVRVKDIFPGGSGSFPNSLTNVNGTLFFTASDGTNGIELWKSNGTSAGTLLVKDIGPGAGGSSPYSLANVNGVLFFRADNGVNGLELWRSNGTEAGTNLVKDIDPGSGGFVASLTNVNNSLFFSAYSGTNGFELWKSDGTEAGTVLVKDINPGSDASNASWLTNVNGSLFFAASDGTTGVELWRSDGTATGTVLVKDFNPGEGESGSNPYYLTNVNGTLFFSADDGANGRELWKSDGTIAGTALVKDINPGNYASYPAYLTNANGKLYFRARNGVDGVELWKSDGTVSGTVQVKDLNVGDSGSYPDSLAIVDNTIYFSAINDDYGREPWQLYLGTAPTVAVPMVDVLAQEDASDLVLDLSAKFADIDIVPFGDVLTLTVTGNTNPALVSATLIGSTLTVRYQVDQYGTATITVRATDLEGAWVEDSFLISVASVPDVPSLVAIGGHEIGEGAWSLVVTALDGDAEDTVTFSLGLGAPAGMTILPGPAARQATISWMAPDQALVSPNPFSITVIVTDNSAGMLSDSEAIEIQVINTAPSASIAGLQVVRAGSLANYTLAAIDPAAADQLAGFTFSIDWDGNGVFDQTTASTTVAHSFAAAGTYQVGVRATDKDGGTGNTFALTVHVWRLAQNGANLEWEGSAGNDSVEFHQTGANSVEVRTLVVGGITTSVVSNFTGVTGRVIAQGHRGKDVLTAAMLNSIPATLEGGFGNDTLTGGGADDILRGEFVGAKGDGAEGNDSITGGAGNDRLEGDGLEGGNDTLRGGSGNDTILGDGGDGMEGRSDTVFGEDGDDQIFGHCGNDGLDGGNDNDLIIGGDGAEANDMLVGGAGNDILSGNDGNDSLLSGPGRDLLLGGFGNDTLKGEVGEDLLIADKITFDLLAAALLSLHAEWTSASSYAVRFAHLTGTPGGLNAGTFLVPGTTVYDDAAIDNLTGGASDLDWFIYNQLDDTLTDHAVGESVTNTSGFPFP